MWPSFPLYQSQSNTYRYKMQDKFIHCIVYLGLRAHQHLRSLAPVNEMMMDDDDDGQMIFGDLVGLKLPDIRLTGEEKPRKNITQETCPDRESNPGPQRDKRACYHLFHSGGLGLSKLVGHSVPLVISWS